MAGHVIEERQSDAVDEWLARVRDAIAGAAGLSRDELRLDQPSIDALLEMARIAAHESGDRRNAPLLCYLIGKAERGASLDVLAAAVPEQG